MASGELDPEQVDEEAFSGTLFTAGLPDPDLLIRTSGEHRISNFLLWQLAYTELFITPVLYLYMDRLGNAGNRLRARVIGMFGERERAA